MAGSMGFLNPAGRQARYLNMRRGAPVKLGPFTGGINTLSDAAAVADNELVDCINFELDVDGSLKCRPPIKLAPDLSGTWTERIICLGVMSLPTGVFLIGSNTNGVYKFASGVWTLITNTFQAACVVQYKDKAWLFAKPGSANPGGSWDGTTFTAVAAMPKCEAATVYKERIYTCPGISSTTNTARLQFSAIADPTTWNGSDFFDVAPGDGQKLIDLIVFNNNLLIFKEHSTFTLGYDTKPADAAITKISNKIGASGPRCVVNAESDIFIYHTGEVYELVNFNWVQVNLKVPFAYDASTPSTRDLPVFMSLFGSRIIVRYYNSIYVLDLRTRVWTRWASADPALHNFGPIVPYPSNVAVSVNDLYYAGSSVLANKNVYVLADGYDTTTTESVPISCSITTKNYTMELPYKFKRMYWWGIDAVTNKAVTGIATPVVLGFQASWGDLLGTTWANLGTWDNPLAAPYSVTTIVATSGSTLRRFFKFAKGMRFRQINFQVQLQSDGSLNDGPAKLYTLDMFVTTGEHVVKAVS